MGLQYKASWTGPTIPEGWDDYSIVVCQQAARVFATTAEDLVQTFVTGTQFSDWWLHANEDIQSSKSGAHFGHYKAAAEDQYLSALHAARINLALETGVPYERWGHGLTVLLEKEFGRIFMDKLRAI